MENLGLTPIYSYLGVFYQSYKVHLSLIKASIFTILYKYVTKSVVILRQ